MRRTHKQIIAQKAEYIAAQIQAEAQQMANFRAAKSGVEASTLLAECIAIKTAQSSIFAANFDRDFGAKIKVTKEKTEEEKIAAHTAYVKAHYSAKEIALAKLHPGLEISEIKQVFFTHDNAK